jgi:hypothetical protein
VPIRSLSGSKGKNRNACRALVRKLEGKSPFGITMLLLEDHIRMGLTEIGEWALKGREWRALLNTVMKIRVS